MLASFKGYTEIVELLIPHTNCNIQNNEDNTALMTASYEGHTEIVKLLIPHTNCNIQNNRGNTALILASYKGYAEIVKLLIPCTDCNIGGGTALTLYKNHKETDIVYQQLIACTDIDSIDITNKQYREIVGLKRKQIREFEQELARDLLTTGLPLNVITQILTESGHITALDLNELTRSLYMITQRKRIDDKNIERRRRVTASKKEESANTS